MNSFVTPWQPHRDFRDRFAHSFVEKLGIALAVFADSDNAVRQFDLVHLKRTGKGSLRFRRRLVFVD